MELGPREIAAPDNGRQRSTVIGDGDEIRRVGKAEMVTVDEVSVCPRRKAREQWMGGPRLDLVPAHVRDLQPRIARLDSDHLALYPAETLDDLKLVTVLRHQLHADADAEKRAGAGHDHLAERSFETGDGSKTAPTVGKSPDAGKHDAVGGGDDFRRAGHFDFGRN